MGVKTGLGGLAGSALGAAGATVSARPTVTEPFSEVPAAKRTRSKAAPTKADAQDDRKGILCRLTVAQRRAVREYCFQREVTLQDMQLRGLDLVLREAGMRPLPEYESPE
jgi:hypothetical protein